MNYALRDGVHCCIANSQMAFLDVDQDAYFALPSDADAVVKRLVLGAQADETDKAVLDHLVLEGLLIESTEHGIETACLSKPTKTAFRRTLRTNSPLLAAAAFACHLWTAITLKSASMRQIVASLGAVTDRSNKYLAYNQSSDGLLQHLAAFEATARIISTQDQCVRSSVALSKFLRRRGYRASLVIGIRLRPFRAHAWVQDGETVMNDDLDDILPFTPILVV